MKITVVEITKDDVNMIVDAIRGVKAILTGKADAPAESDKNIVPENKEKDTAFESVHDFLTKGKTDVLVEIVKNLGKTLMEESPESRKSAVKSTPSNGSDEVTELLKGKVVERIGAFHPHIIDSICDGLMTQGNSIPHRQKLMSAALFAIIEPMDVEKRRKFESAIPWFAELQSRDILDIVEQVKRNQDSAGSKNSGNDAAASYCVKGDIANKIKKGLGEEVHGETIDAATKETVIKFFKNAKSKVMKKVIDGVEACKDGVPCEVAAAAVLTGLKSKVSDADYDTLNGILHWLYDLSVENQIHIMKEAGVKIDLTEEVAEDVESVDVTTNLHDKIVNFLVDLDPSVVQAIMVALPLIGKSGPAGMLAKATVMKIAQKAPGGAKEALPSILSLLLSLSNTAAVNLIKEAMKRKEKK